VLAWYRRYARLSSEMSGPHINVGATHGQRETPLLIETRVLTGNWQKTRTQASYAPLPMKELWW